MRKAFAIVHTWPDLKNAEYEVLQRLLGAARRVGALAVVVDRSGTVIWADPALPLPVGKTLPEDAVTFLLSMHFESGRVLDCYSYITLWQPIEFYHHFGYQVSIDKVSSYHDLVSCDSTIADAHALNLFEALGRAPPVPLPRMFHSLPEPFLEPSTSATSSLFYIGINWERLGRPNGRFHEVLVALDKQSLVEIYGPELLHGVAPWEGYASYRGELPFDGVSVKNAINRAGICLVLSSAAHKSAGIMSNRLFEGLAGGAALVATPNALIDKYFAEIVYPVDDTRGEAVLGQQIVAAVRQIRADPAEARRRVLEGQRIMREHCSLEASIEGLFAATAARKAAFAAKFLADADVTVILTFEGEALADLAPHLDQFARQIKARIVLHVICTERFARRHGAEVAGTSRGSLESVTLHPISLSPAPEMFDGPLPTGARTGPTTARILAEVATPYFAFFTGDDSVFSDHFASVARTFGEQPDAMAACTGMIVDSEAADRTRSRTFDSARFADQASILLVTGAGEQGRFVYRSALLHPPAEHLMTLLDGEEHSYFRLAALLAGPLAQTNHASYVARRPVRAMRQPVEPVQHQRQYIRDVFTRDTRWLKALGAGVKVPEFVYAYSPGTPIRWQDYTTPPAVSQRLTLDALYETSAGGNGLDFLASGFSVPEPHHVWLEAERGVIAFSLAPNEADAAESYTLVLSARGRRSVQSGRNQHMTFAVNGMVIGYAELPEQFATVRLPIPIHLTNAVRAFRMEITPDHAEMVYHEDGRLADARRLSICLRSFCMELARGDPPVLLAPDRAYGCAAGDPGVSALHSGFYAPEHGLSWIAGQKGIMRFQLAAAPPEPELRLRLSGRRSLETGQMPRVGVTVNGVALGDHLLDAGECEVCLDLSAVDLSRGVVLVMLSVSHAESVYDEDHVQIDNRLLGVGVVSLGVFAAEGPVGGNSAEDVAPAKKGRQRARPAPDLPDRLQTDGQPT